MQSWRLGFLGIETIPAWLGGFEVEQFFRLSPAEIATIKTRRGDEMQLGLALHISFMRMSGRALNSSDVIHWRILAFLGAQLDIRAPKVASLRALYTRRRTLYEHQQLAKAQLGFKSLIEPAQRQMVAHLRQTRGATTEPAELLAGARQWLYEHHYLIPAERHLLDVCRNVLNDQEAKLVKAIEKAVPLSQRKKWIADLSKPYPTLPGQSHLDWLRQSPRSRRGQGLAGAFERIFFLIDLKVDAMPFPAMPLEMAKAYAARTARLKLTRITRLKPATQTIGLTCFLQVALWRTTDEAIEAWLMRVSEIRRHAMERAAKIDEQEWRQRHASLLERVRNLAAESNATSLSAKLAAIVSTEERMKKLTRADRARSKLTEMSAQVRSLLRLMLKLPIQVVAADAWLAQAIPLLQAAYRRPKPALTSDASLDFLPKLWRPKEVDGDSAARLRLLEAATLLHLQRSLRNGGAAIRGSLSYREYQTLLIPQSAWEDRRAAHLQLLDSTRDVDRIVDRLRIKVSMAMESLARAVRKGRVSVSQARGIELWEAPEKSPDRDALEDRTHQLLLSRFGTIELPRLMMEVDAQVRFSSTLLRRTPENPDEIMALYGALLAHGMGLDRVQVARMIPTASDSLLRTMMLVLQEEGRLAEASLAVVQYMRRHSIVGRWGEDGLASADMMTVESSRRLWNARIDPRTGNYAIGTYTHVLDQWGIAHDQPIILNRRQAGPAIEGVLLQRLVQIDRLAVDTHGYTDVAMGLANLLGFSLCPHLAMLRERKLCVAGDQYVPKALRIATERLPLKILTEQWDELLRLAASIREGWCTASQVLSRLSSDARGNPTSTAAGMRCKAYTRLAPHA